MKTASFVFVFIIFFGVVRAEELDTQEARRAYIDLKVKEGVIDIMDVVKGTSPPWVSLKNKFFQLEKTTQNKIVKTLYLYFAQKGKVQKERLPLYDYFTGKTIGIATGEGFIRE